MSFTRFRLRTPRSGYIASFASLELAREVGRLIRGESAILVECVHGEGRAVARFAYMHGEETRLCEPVVSGEG